MSIYTKERDLIKKRLEELSDKETQEVNTLSRLLGILNNNLKQNGTFEYLNLRKMTHLEPLQEESEFAFRNPVNRRLLEKEKINKRMKELTKSAKISDQIKRVASNGEIVLAEQEEEYECLYAMKRIITRNFKMEYFYEYYDLRISSLGKMDEEEYESLIGQRNPNPLDFSLPRINKTKDNNTTQRHSSDSNFHIKETLQVQEDNNNDDMHTYNPETHSKRDILIQTEKDLISMRKEQLEKIENKSDKFYPYELSHENEYRNLIKMENIIAQNFDTKDYYEYYLLREKTYLGELDLEDYARLMNRKKTLKRHKENNTQTENIQLDNKQNSLIEIKTETIDKKINPKQPALFTIKPYGYGLQQSTRTGRQNEKHFEDIEIDLPAINGSNDNFDLDENIVDENSQSDIEITHRPIDKKYSQIAKLINSILTNEELSNYLPIKEQNLLHNTNIILAKLIAEITNSKVYYDVTTSEWLIDHKNIKDFTNIIE